MKNSVITAFEKRKFADTKPLPKFRPGDTVCVHYRIVEGKRSRIQQFEGVVLRYKKGTADSSFTVRKISAGGIGVERVFPVYSPSIEKLDVKSHGIVRRARLYYLRDLSGKAARIKSRFVGVAKKTKAEKK